MNKTQRQNAFVPLKQFRFFKKGFFQCNHLINILGKKMRIVFGKQQFVESNRESLPLSSQQRLIQNPGCALPKWQAGATQINENNGWKNTASL